MGKYSDYDHPNSVCMSYSEHLYFSCGLGLDLAAASVKAFVHGLIPACFITSSTDSMREINKKLNNNGCINKRKPNTTKNADTNTEPLQGDIDLELGGWHNIINGGDK